MVKSSQQTNKLKLDWQEMLQKLTQQIYKSQTDPKTTDWNQFVKNSKCNNVTV